MYRIRWLHDKDLQPGALALRVRAVGRVHGRRKSRTVTAVYQADADLLSGVYGNGSGRMQQSVTLHAATASGRNLKNAH
jgi:hypothetical protein